MDTFKKTVWFEISHTNGEVYVNDMDPNSYRAKSQGSQEETIIGPYVLEFSAPPEVWQEASRFKLNSTLKKPGSIPAAVHIGEPLEQEEQDG